MGRRYGWVAAGALYAFGAVALWWSLLTWAVSFQAMLQGDNFCRLRRERAEIAMEEYGEWEKTGWTPPRWVSLDSIEAELRERKATAEKSETIPDLRSKESLQIESLLAAVERAREAVKRAREALTLTWP